VSLCHTIVIIYLCHNVMTISHISDNLSYIVGFEGRMWLIILFWQCEWQAEGCTFRLSVWFSGMCVWIAAVIPWRGGRG